MPDPLDGGRAALVRVSAALATRRPEAVRAALEAAARDADPRAVEEALLQAHLFVGFPDALNALVLWREVSGLAASEASGEACDGWEARGAEVCARVYGKNYEKLRRNVRALHPEFDRWMVEGGYGRVLGRAGLDLRTRELCILALLAVWNAPRQLHSHLRGALNAGADVAEVDRAVEIACGYLDPDRASGVRALWSEIGIVA